jgi:DNA polymerase III delta subunit
MSQQLNTSINTYYELLQKIIAGTIETQYFFFFGSQQKIKHIVTQELKKYVQKKHQQFETILMYGDEITVQDFLHSIEDNGFFSTTKVFILRNASSFLVKNAKVLQSKKVFVDLSDQNFIIFEDSSDKKAVVKALKKELSSFALIDDASVPETQICRWIRKKFHEFSLDPPKDMIKKCVVENKNDLDRIWEVTERICLENAGIEKPMWDKAFRTHQPSIEEVIFSLSDSIVAGEKEKALHTLDNLIRNGKSYDEIFYYLLNQFAFLSEVSFYTSKKLGLPAITKKMAEYHSYRVKMAVNQLSKVSFNRVKRGYDQLLEMDVKRKKGTLLPLANALVLFMETM